MWRCPPMVQNGGALEKVAMTNRDPADVVSVDEVERILILTRTEAQPGIDPPLEREAPLRHGLRGAASHGRAGLLRQPDPE